MGIRRVAGLTWNCPLMMRVENSAGKSTSGMDKFGSVIDRMNMKPTLILLIPDTSIKQLALGEFPLQHQILQRQPNTAQLPTSRLWYLSNYHGAMQAYMHPQHKLGNANTVANNHEYYQTLI